MLAVVASALATTRAGAAGDAYDPTKATLRLCTDGGEGFIVAEVEKYAIARCNDEPCEGRAHHVHLAHSTNSAAASPELTPDTTLEVLDWTPAFLSAGRLTRVVFHITHLAPGLRREARLRHSVTRPHDERAETQGEHRLSQRGPASGRSGRASDGGSGGRRGAVGGLAGCATPSCVRGVLPANSQDDRWAASRPRPGDEQPAAMLRPDNGHEKWVAPRCPARYP